MELRHLRYFVAVAEELHFRRAAERLHIAQPAVSEQIRKLEAELGVLLLHRTQRSVSLTEAGQVLLEDARRILHQADCAQRAARRAHEGSFARVRIGYVPDAIPPAVPRALGRLRQSAPNVDVELAVGDARALLGEVRNHRLDAAIVALPAPVDGLRLTDVAYEEAVVAVAANALEDLSAEPLELGELADRPVLLMARTTNPAFYDAVVAAFRNADLVPTLTETSAQVVEHLLLEVAAGSGAALLPASVAERLQTPGIAFRALAAEAPGCRIVVVSRDETPTVGLATFLRDIAVVSAARRRQSLAAA